MALFRFIWSFLSFYYIDLNFFILLDIVILRSNLLKYFLLLFFLAILISSIFTIYLLVNEIVLNQWTILKDFFLISLFQINKGTATPLIRLNFFLLIFNFLSSLPHCFQSFPVLNHRSIWLAHRSFHLLNLGLMSFFFFLYFHNSRNSSLLLLYNDLLLRWIAISNFTSSVLIF